MEDCNFMNHLQFNSVESTCDYSSLFPESKVHVSPRGSSSSSSNIISFVKPMSSGGENAESFLKVNIGSPDDEIRFRSFNSCEGSNKKSRTPPDAREHTMAERKRREKLAHLFISLSSLIPGLKKLDKASILEDATEYLKRLQERAKLLEEEANRKPEESVVYVNKSQSSPYDNNSHGCSNEQLPVIEAKVSGKNVLIRIHCGKEKKIVAEMLSQIERLHLSVINTSVLPFGDYSMHVTIVAQMDADFCLTVNDLVRNLRMALARSSFETHHQSFEGEV